jgi:hypothetical protein
MESEFKGLGLPTGTVGTISELRVSILLLSQGYEVFRSLSPSCSCDLAVLRDHKLTRIDVKTGYYTPTGKVAYNRTNLRADVAAVCLPDKVMFVPEL